MQELCRMTFAVDFPMFEKTRARQGVAGPLYETLGRLTGDYPRWNFHKNLIDREGQVEASYPSRVKPQSTELLCDIEGLL